MDFRYTFQTEAPKAFAGVDVGGTKIAAIIADTSGRLLSRVVRPTPVSSPESTLSSIADAVRSCADEAGLPISRIAAVGIGIPGRVDRRTGLVQQAVNLGWEEVPAGSRLSNMLGVPCVLENDVSLAAIGLQRQPDQSQGSARSLAYISVGTGIAAGFVLKGELYRGAHGMAGEIGHAILDPRGPLCACGAHGCLESFAAGPAIARMAREAIMWGAHTSISSERLDAEAVYKAADGGDALAYSIARKVGSYLAQAIQQVIMHYDIERVIIGGGVSRAGTAFLHPILQALEVYRCQSDFQREMIRPGMITLLDPTYDAGAWGGIALASDLVEVKGSR